MWVVTAVHLVLTNDVLPERQEGGPSVHHASLSQQCSCHMPCAADEFHIRGVKTSAHMANCCQLAMA